MLLYLLYSQAFQGPFMDAVLNLPVSNKPRKPKKMQMNHNFNPMVYFVHIVFFFLLLNSFGEEWNIHHRVTFKRPTKLQSTEATAERQQTSECDCRNVFLRGWQKLLWNSCRYIYIPSGLHSRGYNTSSPKSQRVVRVWAWEGDPQVRSSHWGTADWQYSYSTTVAQRNTSRGKWHNIHFRVCFVFVSFSFFFCFFETKNFGSGENLKITRQSITLQVHQTLFLLSIKWGNQTCVTKCRPVCRTEAHNHCRHNVKNTRRPGNCWTSTIVSLF